MIRYDKKIFQEIEVTAQISSFCGEGNVEEWHVMLHVQAGGFFSEQMERLHQAESLLMGMQEWKGVKCVARRYFLSDSANQYREMSLKQTDAVSVIQQPPLDGSKVALWLYLTRGMEVVQEHGTTVCQSNGYTHLWRMGMQHPEGDSAVQTTALLDGYEESLSQFGANVADNCIRTWFFVRDVDTHYAGLVQARKEWFTRHGLTENTHYIASTGIGGGPADTKALVQLGAYSLQGFESAQVRYLHAPQWLNATHEYGVTFERGTAVEYGDRAHVIISGTASIDHLGQVVYPGDIVGQTKRMWVNVEALLGEASASMDDMMHIIVYLRDMADYEVVRSLFAERFPQTPTVITLAPVCRPAWLIEMECIAVVSRKNASFRNF
ncbi:MAG: hypothetical protein IIV14_01235 [Bacteroidaceae bacterium]|nr:hypothetical protein [Bacteroidaceae bacterium]